MLLGFIGYVIVDLRLSILADELAYWDVLDLIIIDPEHLY
jgi:hypothetical protein